METSTAGQGQMDARADEDTPRNAEEALVCRAATRRILATMRVARESGKHPPWRWRDEEPVGHHLRRAALHATDAATAEEEHLRFPRPGEDVAHALTRLAFAAVMGQPDLVEASQYRIAVTTQPRDRVPADCVAVRVHATFDPVPTVRDLLDQVRRLRARLMCCEQRLRADAGEDDYERYRADSASLRSPGVHTTRDLLYLSLTLAERTEIRARAPGDERALAALDVAWREFHLELDRRAQAARADAGR